MIILPTPPSGYTISQKLTLLASRLDRAKETGPGKYQAYCQSHNGKTPSLGITALLAFI
jgi:hypothetical protein